MSTEHRASDLIRSWLDETYEAERDPQDYVDHLLEAVPDTPQQRQRWWPIPLSRRGTRTPTATPTDATEYQASPIPASNGHTPTIIRRTRSMPSPVTAITAGALVFAIGGAFLIAQSFDQQPATGPGAATEAEAMRPAMVTGTLLHHYESGEETGRVETNDQRLNGDITSDGSFESFPDVLLPEEPGIDADQASHYEAGGAELSWGSLRITNDDGSWDGHVVCTPTLQTNGSEDPCFIELSGAGGYDGLSALLVTRDRISAVGFEPRDETYVLDGLVFPGDLPPGR